ncbi:DNA translocase FtsK [Clostridium sp.]|uniref:DNA translocase FtsK n=1 Tax=Clostridium sp. TaxID=1506 RepID=UPI0039965648
MANVKSKKKGNSNKKTTNKVTKQSKDNSEIYGILVISCSLIFMFSLYSNKAGYLSIISQKIFISLIGVGAFFIPIYMIAIAVRYYFLKEKIVISRKYWGVTGLIIGTLILLETLDLSTFYIPGSIMKSLESIIMYSSNGYIWHGGIISFLVVLPIYKLIGYIGLYILVIAIYIICSILIFNYNIRGLMGEVKEKKLNIRPKKKTREREYVEEYNDEKENTTPFARDYLENSIGLNDERKNNNKMKILDFMKNSKIDEEVEETKVDFKETIDKEITIVEEPIREESKKSKKVERKVPDSVDKEIEHTLNNTKEKKEKYTFPTIDLLALNNDSKMNNADKKELLENAGKLERTLKSFGVDAEILQVTKGPSVTRFEIQPKAGIKVSKIVNLSDDIALGLAAGGIRMEAPIPGKSAIGIEVPNKKQTPVYFREIIESKEFKESKAKVACALGKDITGKSIVTDLSAMPHLLIAGATGSGKSVCINTLIVSILYKYSPEEVKLLMVDPKVVELNVYNGIPHLLIPVVTEPKKAAGALNWAVNEMNKRYKLFAETGVRNIGSYNNFVERTKTGEKLPYIVIIVDELADLMMVCPHDVEDSICRLAQMARAAGMHLVLATQRPSVDVITGVIKANIPSRISFAVSSQIDSRTILDSSGAEKLLGRGDMLFSPIGESNNLRVQGAFISEEEVEQVVNHIKESEDEVDTAFEEEILEHINSASIGGEGGSSEDRDELLDEAIQIVVESGQVSASFIQRRLKVGFNRAARIMEQLEDMGIISKRDGNKPRQVLKTKEELEKY